MKLTLKTTVAAIFCVLPWMGGCQNATTDETPAGKTEETIAELSETSSNQTEETIAEVIETYAQIVYLSYADSLRKARAMSTAIETFVENPSEENLKVARQSWIDARLPYLQTEVFRFYGGPIDDENGPEGLLNAWPMDEAYVDYVKDDPDAGIINDPERYPEINTENLTKWNESEGEENVSTGYHAIEFLLWGQDLRADGPGNRPHTDYSSEPNAERRKKFLLAATGLLLEKLEGLVAEWKPDKDNYRRAFMEAKPLESMEKILAGMTLLSGFELAGERLLVAYESQAQEDEHSCFSDTTHNDCIYDLIGIQNVWQGRYEKVDGAVFTGLGLRAAASSKAPEKTAAIDALLARSMKQAKAIPVPFDQAILGDNESKSRKEIMALVENLEDISENLAAIGFAFGFKVPTEVDE